MIDYFDRFELAMDGALVRGAHLPWYSRVAELRRRPRRLVAAALATSAMLAPATIAAGVFVLDAHPQIVCSADAHSAAHASLVDATLPQWLPSTGS